MSNGNFHFKTFGKNNGDFLIVDKDSACSSVSIEADGRLSILRDIINEAWELIAQSNTEAVFKRKKPLNSW